MPHKVTLKNISLFLNHNLGSPPRYRWTRLCSQQDTTMIFPTCRAIVCTRRGTAWVCTSMFFPPPLSIPLWLLWVSFMALEPSCPKLRCRPVGSHVFSKVRVSKVSKFCLSHPSVYRSLSAVIWPSGYKKLPSHQAMIKAVEKDTKDIEKKWAPSFAWSLSVLSLWNFFFFKLFGHLRAASYKLLLHYIVWINHLKKKTTQSNISTVCSYSAGYLSAFMLHCVHQPGANTLTRA